MDRVVQAAAGRGNSKVDLVCVHVTPEGVEEQCTARSLHDVMLKLSCLALYPHNLQRGSILLGERPLRLGRGLVGCRGSRRNS
jgi:hypothetical protein